MQLSASDKRQRFVSTKTKKRVTTISCNSLLLIYFAVWTGLEPATPCVTGRYSNQLNYHTGWPSFSDSERKGKEIFVHTKHLSVFFL